MHSRVPKPRRVVAASQIAAVVGLVASVSALPPTFTTIALTGQPAPAIGIGVNYASLPLEPSINAAGNVAFLGTVSGTGVTVANDTALWAGQPISLSLVARKGSPAAAAGAGVTFATLGTPVLSASGLQIAFDSLLAGTGVTTANDECLWAGPIGNPGITMREGSPAPGTGAGVNHGAIAGLFVHGASGASPMAAFAGYLTGTGVVATNNLGLWAGPPTAVSLVARTGSPAPGTAAGVNFGSVGDPVIAVGGRLAFPATLLGTGINSTNNAGIWTGIAGSAPTLAVRLGAAAPGAGTGVNFQTIGNPAINNAGQIAFVANLTGTGITSANNVGIWSGAPGSIVLVARAGAPAPGAGAGAVFGSSFSSPMLGASGAVAFAASLVGATVTADNDTAIWLASGGTLTMVAREGSQAPGTPAGVVFRSLTTPPALAASGQVAFTAFVGGAGITLGNDFGIWATSPAGTLDLVVREGDAILAGGSTRTVNGLTVLPATGGEEGKRSAFNDLGQLVFRATFTDATTGLMLAQIGAPCRVDLDGNGQIQPADVAAFISGWTASITGGTLAGDFDRNGAVEPADVAAFVAAWFTALSSGC